MQSSTYNTGRASNGIVFGSDTCVQQGAGEPRNLEESWPGLETHQASYLEVTAGGALDPTSAVHNCTATDSWLDRIAYSQAGGGG